MGEKVRNRILVLLSAILMAFAVESGEKGSTLPVIQTEDGFTLSYQVFLPTLKGDESDKVKPPFSVILLVHDYNGSKKDWTIGSEHLPGVLTKEGYAVVVFDLRGHGDTVHKDPNLLRAANFPPEVLARIGKDFSALITGLKSLNYLNFNNLVVVASGWASAQVLAYFPENPKPKALIFATPRMKLFRWEEGLVAKSVPRWKGVPIWVGACKSAPGMKEVQDFVSAFPSSSVQEAFLDCKTPAYGTFLFMSEPAFRERLIAFLNGLKQ
jgi:pimeloyl-ACP methyl ester carboxylesterase